MDFKLNRSNRILEVTLKNLEDEAAVPITFPKMELNQSYVPVVEEILTGVKSCSDHEYIMVDEIIVEEAVYQALQSGTVYEMTGSGLLAEKTKDSNVSVSLGDQVAAFQGI